MCGVADGAASAACSDHRREIDVRITDMNWMQVEEYLRHDDP